MCMPKVLACLSKPERTYSSLTLQLDTVITEESLVKVLSLRGKYLPSQNGTYGDTGFCSAQTTYLSMKVLKMRTYFKPLLTRVMIKNIDTLLTTQNFSLTCSSGALCNN